MARRLGPTLAAQLALALGACGEGAVEVVLEQPSAEAARPVGASQVVVRAHRADGDIETRTSVIRDGRFDLGDLPVADYTGMTVELRDEVGVMVGFGRSTAGLEVSADGRATYSIPVRRPRAYLIGNAAGARITDPLDGADDDSIEIDRGAADVIMRPRRMPVTAGHITAGGADLFIASGTRVFRFDSSTDAVADTALADVGVPILDLAATPDGAWIAAATAGGVALIDTASGAIAPSGITEATGKVTFTRGADGGILAVALLAPVDTSAGCPGGSRLAITPVPGGETSARIIDTGTGLADIAGSTVSPRVLAAGYCRNAAITYDAMTGTELGAIGDVTAATVAAVAGERGWVAGTVPGVTTAEPPDNFEYTTVAATHVLATAALIDGSGRVDRLPALQQTVFTTDDETASFAQTIRAKAARVTALVPSTSGDRVTVVGVALHRNVGRSITNLGVTSLIVPPMAVHAAYAVTIVDGVGVVDRVRTRCAVCTFDASPSINEMGTGCGTTLTWLYANWQCADDAGVNNLDINLELGAGAALFGQP